MTFPPLYRLRESAERAEQALPEGYRVEVLGGELVASPPRLNRHNFIVHSVMLQLEAQLPDDVSTLPDTSVGDSGDDDDLARPDLIVLPSDALQREVSRNPPDSVALALEVASPGSTPSAVTTKPLIYAGMRIPVYLTADPRDGTLVLHSDPREGTLTTKHRMDFGTTVKLPPPLSGIVVETDTFITYSCPPPVDFSAHCRRLFREDRMPPAPLSDDHSSPAFLLSSTHRRARRLLSVLDKIDDPAVRCASALPGWTRGHVASHIAGVARALARQARYAVEGRLIDVYDGGREGRDAAIESGARRSAAELRADVTEAVAEIEASWPPPAGPGWDRPVRHRDGTVLSALQCWWRELVLHTDDLDLPGAPRDWEPEFYVHLTDFLAPRAPEGVRLVLSPTDGAPRRAIGDGRAVEVTGTSTDLAAFLAGRGIEEGVTTDTGEDVDLRPWP